MIAFQAMFISESQSPVITLTLPVRTMRDIAWGWSPVAPETFPMRIGGLSNMMAVVSVILMFWMSENE